MRAQRQPLTGARERERRIMKYRQNLEQAEAQDDKGQDDFAG